MNVRDASFTTDLAHSTSSIGMLQTKSQTEGTPSSNHRSRGLPYRITDIGESLAAVTFPGELPQIHQTKGNKYVITCINYEMPWAETRIVPTGTASEVAQFLLENVNLWTFSP
ncbi:hypothetical protein PR048_005671 [Dryococelus australis]|uniref:Uncharacterized protein n=1 Tax=Dryococelus australis TaxID=614101 RepID=A0ABQ9I8V9_9NEOP|nr:hypothetical protein PR048_005671 [Dryococelus australis]